MEILVGQKQVVHARKETMACTVNSSHVGTPPVRRVEGTINASDTAKALYPC